MNDNDKPKSKSSVTSFVCGIISIVGHLFFWIGWLITYMEVKQGLNIFFILMFFYILQFPFGITAIISGAIGTKKTKSKLAKVGLIFGIIGVILSMFYYFQTVSTLTRM